MKHMTFAILRNNIKILYTCYNGVLRYGKKCQDRDDGSHCMNCKYCKAQLSAPDATRLINSYTRRTNEKI